MLSGKVNSSKSNNDKSPPPIPPKPKTGLVNTSQSYNSSAWRLGFSTKSDTYSPVEAANKNNISQKYDAHYQAMQLDNNDQDYYLKSTNTTTSVPKPRPTKVTAFTSNTTITSVYSNQPTEVYISQEDDEDDGDYDVIQDKNVSMFNNSSNAVGSNNKPIVTESPEEAHSNNNNNNNNNNERNVAKQNKAINTSTVEILEVPLKRYSTTAKQNQQPNIIHDNLSYPSSPDKLQHQRRHLADSKLFYENNNTYAAPVVTTTTDDEDDDDVMLPTEVEVETILNESSLNSNLPPRTSTPTHTDTRDYSRSASKTNNCLFKSKNTGGSSSGNNTSNEDTANISIETDEQPATPLNQSSGGEIVGISETSDHANNSKDIASFRYNNTSNQDEMHKPQPFTNQSTVYEQDFSQKEHSVCQEKLRGFENLTQSLMNEVEELKTQIVKLTSKVADLEKQVEKNQQVVTIRNNEISADNRSALNISTKQNDSLSPSSMSQSTSTINRIISSSNPPGYSSSRRTPNSRGNLATISRTPTSYPSPNGETRLAAASQSYNNTVTKPLKKNNFQHASTNSLYAESLKSCSNSISPTSNYAQRRDPLSYTSLLSLSSIGGSTLKKATGSVLNLSQVGNQALSQWPSITDFLPAKHRAKEIVYDESERTVNMVLYSRLITMRLPSWINTNYSLEKVVEPPTIRLKLDWVHGYRGRDCRANVSYLPTGECIYFVASIVVLYNPNEKTQRHYLGHTDSVKCLAVHPNKLIVASGQSAVLNRRDKRPIVRVWNTVNLATIRVIGFNEDFDRSICCLAFSKQDQGATLAVVDESNEHTITLLDWQREKNWRIAETNSGHEPVLAIDFHPIEKYSLVAVGKSSINFWDTRGMTLTKRAGLFDKYDKPKYVLCLTFNDLGETITGDSNGSIIIWPRGGNRPKRIIHDAHQAGVFSVLAMKDGSYLTGGRDRRVVEWNENFEPTGREAELPEHCGGVRYITYARGSLVLIGTLRNSILLGSLDTNFDLIMRGHSEAISSLAVHPHLNQYVTGGFDDQIHLFDSKSHDVVWSKSLMMPITAAAFSPNGLLLVVGSTLGKWLVLDAITQEILFTKCDGSGSINCIKFSPDGEYFSMGSSDCHIYVYQATDSGNKFSRTGTCVGHSAPVKELDWSEDGRYMQSQSMNFELLFWKTVNCRPADDSELVEDIKWYTHNCTIGFNAIGLWTDSIDSALITYCDKSNDKDLIVSVTDTGNINIFKWPSCYNQCLSQKFYGNVEKFHFIKFLADDSKLVAVGAKSCVTTEWKVDKGARSD